MKILKTVLFVACMLCANGAFSVTPYGINWTSAPRTAAVGEIITVSAKYYNEFGVYDATFCCAGNADGEFISSMPSV